MNVDATITLVCSFARAGSSLTMSMLAAGGMPIYAENVLSYEHSNASRLPRDVSWIAEARGRAVKILDPHIHVPPATERYRAVWLDRDPQQQARSHLKFLGSIDPAIATGRRVARRLAAGLKRDRPRALKVLRGLTDELLILRFENIVAAPRAAADELNRWAGGGLDVEAMAARVVSRGPDCLPYLLEDEQIAKELSR